MPMTRGHTETTVTTALSARQYSTAPYGPANL